MYPSNNTDRWSEIKYNPDSLTTTNFDSHSLSYTLCDIAVKSLDCCLHNEKVGAALTVYRNIMSAFTQIYKIYEAQEFGDIFIKILNGFDFVMTSLTLMNKDNPVRHILQEAVTALKVANSVFNCEKYSSDSEKSHPKAKVLFSSTLKLQQELRKGLFNCYFMIQADVDSILEFFSYKKKLDSKDEFVVQSFQRAKEAASVYEYAWKFRLNMTNGEEGDITSASEFKNLVDILNKLLVCIEMCLEFPFESCLLNVIEYWELMEQSSLESSLEDIIKLFTNYLKVPLQDVKLRIIKKMIVRLQLREELIKQNDNKVKSKFLVKFLHRAPIMKLITKDLMMSSIPNDDGYPEENDLTNLIIQFVSMLMSCATIDERRMHSKAMHSYQIASICYKSNPTNVREIKYIIDTIEDC